MYRLKLIEKLAEKAARAEMLKRNKQRVQLTYQSGVESRERLSQSAFV